MSYFCFSNMKLKRPYYILLIAVIFVATLASSGYMYVQHTCAVQTEKQMNCCIGSCSSDECCATKKTNVASFTHIATLSTKPCCSEETAFVSFETTFSPEYKNISAPAMISLAFSFYKIDVSFHKLAKQIIPVSSNPLSLLCVLRT